MKTWRRIGAWSLFALVSCALGGTACAPVDQRDGSVRLAVMLPPSERAFWEPIARDFERDHPDVTVDLVEGPQSTDLREGLYTASLLARDPTFDLVYMDVTWPAKFANAGWLRPLDSVFEPEERTRFLPAALRAGEFEGHLYRIPVRTDCGVLYYRADLLLESGRSPPRTFADLEASARALQSPPERWGFVWQGKQYEGLVCAFLEVLRGHGGFWVKPETREVGLDDPRAVAALKFLVRALHDDPISPPGVPTYQEEESRRLFHDGRAVFLRNWPYAWRLLQSESSALRGRVGVVPMVQSADGVSSATLGGWGLGISAYSRHPEQAAAFIRWATSIESQRLLCGPSGYAPARIDAYRDSALLAANPFLAEIERLHAFAVPRPALARYALASDILQRHLSAALTGAVDAERALRDAARETRDMLGATAPRARAEVRS